MLYSKILFLKSPLRYLPRNSILHSDWKFPCHSENSNTLNSSRVLLSTPLSGQVLLSSLPFELKQVAQSLLRYVNALFCRQIPACFACALHHQQMCWVRAVSWLRK